MTIYNKLDDRRLMAQTFTGEKVTIEGIEYFVSETGFKFPVSEWSATPTETSPER